MMRALFLIYLLIIFGIAGYFDFNDEFNRYGESDETNNHNTHIIDTNSRRM